MVAQAAAAIRRLKWPMVEKMLLGRIPRLADLGECPLIYIGSAGTLAKSKNTLRGRHREFGYRHTAMYPLWTLLYFEWELEYGWRIVDNPGELEQQLKERYRGIHGGRLPALVAR